MTNAEKELVKFLIEESGVDYCQKCIHCKKTSGEKYVPNSINEEQFDGECDIEYCINGMTKYFKRELNRNK